MARLRCTRSKDNQTGQEEDRFYLTSLSPTAGAEAVMRAARLHWGIENCLHWKLDTAFKDDLNRARRGNAQANL
ncbi:ISAs1 family transposase, partial [Acinetobacter baumannii]